jgi:uracil-DNA glycosylase
MTFAMNCRLCPRLAGFLDQVRAEHPDYHALPVDSFGEAGSPFLIVGLAPGMHGANRTGRPFTGDHAGNLLYGSLHKYGFATHPEPLDSDGNANLDLHLVGCRITNAVRCLPPQNKPEPGEIKTCNSYVTDELAILPKGAAVLALGTIAHQAVLMALQLRKSSYAFAHGAQHVLPNGVTLFDSYHCSRYNTQTKRLTTPMFENVIAAIAQHIGN